MVNSSNSDLALRLDWGDGIIHYPKIEPQKASSYGYVDLVAFFKARIELLRFYVRIIDEWLIFYIFLFYKEGYYYAVYS